MPFKAFIMPIMKKTKATRLIRKPIKMNDVNAPMTPIIKTNKAWLA